MWIKLLVGTFPVALGRFEGAKWTKLSRRLFKRCLISLFYIFGLGVPCIELEMLIYMETLAVLFF